MNRFFKIRCLVLTLVLTLTLFGSAEAAFTDEHDVKYTEAVEVMTGIGAINGYTDGSIKPTGTITREEAAKLVAYSILGKNVAEKLTVGATGFRDVEADRWSAPFISYLVGEGIVSGMGDGTFAPTANVTGYQFAKMMLAANGYGAEGEFTGVGWDVAVAVAGNKAKIFSGAGQTTDSTKAATREQAMLYAFNGIQVPQVSYNKLTGQYDPVTLPNAGGAQQASTIAATVYPELVKAPITINGVSGYNWTLKSKPISGFVTDATTLATSIDGTSLATLTTASHSRYIGYKPDTNVDYYVNGTLVGSNADGMARAQSSVVRGAVIRFIDNSLNRKYDTVTVERSAVARVTGAPIVTATVSIPGIPGLMGADSAKVSGYEGLAKGDYVLWYQSSDGVFHLTKCARFTGTVSAVDAANEAVRIDGKQYHLSGLADVNSLAETANRSIGAANTVFYTDAGGHIAAIVPAPAVIGPQNTLFVLSGTDTGTKVLFPSGAVETISTVNTTEANRFYTYTKGEDGVYALSPADYQVTNTASVSAPLTSASVKHIVRSGVAKFMGTYRTTPMGDGHFAWEKTPGSYTDALGTAATIFTYLDAGSTQARYYHGLANTAEYTADQPGSLIACLVDGDGYALWTVAVGGTVEPDRDNGEENDFPGGDYFPDEAISAQ